MPKQKHDFSALKLEFMESDVDEVQEFLRRKFGEKLATSNMKNKCKGRSKEKQEHKMKIVEEALKKNAKKQADELSIPLEDIMKGKKAVLGLLLHHVSKYVKANKDKDGDKEIDVGDAERILKMFKTELGEPATIGANYNMNASKVEGLTEEESEALDLLFSGKIRKGKKSSK